MQVLVVDAAAGTDFAVLRYWIVHESGKFSYAPFVIVPQTPPQLNVEQIARMYELSPREMAAVRQYFTTAEEKHERRKRGWQLYRLPVISAPVLAIRRCLQFNLGVDNIGCRNFKKRCR